MHTAPRALLFDLDETLVDRRGGLVRYAELMWATRAVTMETYEDFVAHVLMLDNNGRTPRHEFFSALSVQCLPEFDALQLRDHFFSTEPARPCLFDNAATVLATLKRQGYRVGIVSNGQSSIQRMTIERNGLDHAADAVVISEEFGGRKPEPAIFSHALALLGVTPDSAIFVGDSPDADVQGALNAGLRAIWLERHTPWPAERVPDYHARIGSLAELLPMLERA